MSDAATMPDTQNASIAEVVEQERARLGNFIRSRVPNVLDAEDILQDVFYELVEANRLLMPIEHLTGWMYRVARNRITDLWRKTKPESLSDPITSDEGEERLLEDVLPSPEDGPDAIYIRKAMLADMEQALRELPEEQRWVFIAHEVEGRSFREMAAETGVGLNTLLARKRYAVLYLRKQLSEHFWQLEGNED